ncbi:MAG: hypothetical protein ACO3FI_06520 [Cyclobacteriaceae bacterium]
MRIKCSSGKTYYDSEVQAVEALLFVWSQISFRDGEGPVTVYCCDDCGGFHLTSKGDMHERLKELLKSGRLDNLREAARWEHKFRKS